MKATDIDIALLLQAIKLKYGYDFNDYSAVHMKRRVQNALVYFKVSRVFDLLEKILYEDDFFYDFFHYISVNVTEMFRDPTFYKAFREELVPTLKTYPFVKIWHAGCATGEEVYSMAILLKEEGLYDRCQIYATDFNNKVLKVAEEGIYPLKNLKFCTSNYHASGGKMPFSDYYSSKYDGVKFNESLKENIVFASHNLATDGGFGDMHVIICRNVMIYFNNDLQKRVLKLFHASLVHKGFLCLGSKESVRFTSEEKEFCDFDPVQKIYRKEYES